MSGPPPKPPHLQIIRGNPGKRRPRQSVEPPIPPQPPEPPDCLSGYSLDEWHRLAPQLHELGLLTALDIAALGAYCCAYERWRTASELLEATPEDERLVVRGKAQPLVKIIRDAANQMLSIGAQFGLSPSTRARVTGITPPREPNKFAGLIAFDDD